MTLILFLIAAYLVARCIIWMYSFLRAGYRIWRQTRRTQKALPLTQPTPRQPPMVSREIAPPKPTVRQWSQPTFIANPYYMEVAAKQYFYSGLLQCAETQLCLN